MREMFDQLQQGLNFEKADDLLGGITPEQASQTVPGAPYTILQNLAHTQIWQRYLIGEPGAEMPRHGDDWPSPEPGEWAELRTAFLVGWERAAQMVTEDPNTATTTKLLHVALHGAYHLGQIALLWRMIEHRLGPNDEAAR